MIIKSLFLKHIDQLYVQFLAGCLDDQLKSTPLGLSGSTHAYTPKSSRKVFENTLHYS